MAQRAGAVRLLFASKLYKIVRGVCRVDCVGIFAGWFFGSGRCIKVALGILAIWTGLVARLPVSPCSTFGPETLESGSLSSSARPASMAVLSQCSACCRS